MPASLLAACNAPVALPERALNDQDVELYWGRDRDALGACGRKVAAIGKLYR